MGNGRGNISSILGGGGGEFTDFGLNLGVDDEKPPFLAVKVTFRVHLKY